MMMPDFKPKYLYLPIVLSSMLVVSGCSALDFFKVDSIDDTVDYKKAANPIRALAIPPGLSNPDFDSTYASVQDGTTGAVPASRVRVVDTAQSQASSTIATLDSAPAPKPMVSDNGGSSLGAALMAQSDANAPAQAQPTQQAARQEVIPDTAIQSPTPTVERSSGSTMPQVAMIRLKGGEPALAINAPYASAWKLLAPVLSDVGFNVGKQQPNQGIITTTFQGQGKSLRSGQGYLILLAENASKQSFIGVADANGKPESEAVAQEVLALIKAAFEK